MIGNTKETKSQQKTPNGAEQDEEKNFRQASGEQAPAKVHENPDKQREFIHKRR